ncbi:MAG: hypothetical protein IKC89_02680 [Lentisphaeria bacterium]|nr:hypothetical protein [Lentisphaeria bacterium]
MRIDDSLRAKLVSAVEKAGGAREFSLKCGVNAANISRYLNRKISSINDDNWEKLAPFLEEAPPVRPDGGNNEGFISSTPELSEFILARMKSCGIASVEELRVKINCSSYQQLRWQISGRLNWFADTLGQVIEVLDIEPDTLPVTPRERRIISHAMMKRGISGVMRMLPVIGGCMCGNFADIESGLSRGTAHPVPVPMDDRRDLRAFLLSGTMMEPTLLNGDIVVTEVADDLFQIPDNMLTVLRFTDEFSPKTRLCCGRFHLLAGKSVILSFDHPGGGFIHIPVSCISWSAIIRYRISDFHG